MKSRYASALLAAAALSAPSLAATVHGDAVDGFGSSNDIGILNNFNDIIYYIPLTADASGVYGVTPVAAPQSSGPPQNGLAGQISDYGTGNGYNDENTDALQMFLRLDLGDLTSLVGEARLVLTFQDLDLTPVNDPSGSNFREDLQINFFDSNGNLQALTDTLLDVSDTTELQAYDSGATINSGGRNDPITLRFPNLAGLINTLYANNADALYLRLDFSSTSDVNEQNTKEILLKAKLKTVVPEPASLALLALGGVAMLRRRVTA